MAPRRKPATRIVKRTPVLEWAAAMLGLLLTLGVLGYSVWEGVTDHQGPPSLTVTSRPAEKTAGGYVTPLTVRNSSHATAAGVEVRATLERAGRVVEERRASFTYVPGQGEANGGVIFQTDPTAATLRLEAEGYQDP
jgi:uncharacterized protein (TIGR02588 family)